MAQTLSFLIRKSMKFSNDYMADENLIWATLVLRMSVILSGGM